MSNSISYYPLSLADVFGLGEISAYDYEGDVLLTVSDGTEKRLIHLYENEVDGRMMYGLNIGSAVDIAQQPLFVGNPTSVEISLAKSDTAWDFLSLTLKDRSGSLLKIQRNDESFPEPTFSRIS